MKLDEITIVSDQTQAGFNISDFDTQHTIQLTTAENIPVIHFMSNGHSLDVYSLFKDDKFITLIIGIWGHLQQQKVFFIKRTFTLKEYRRQGLASALYNALLFKLKYTLASDNELVPTTLKIWKSMNGRLNLKALHETNKEILPIQQAEEKWDVYNDENVIFIADINNALPEGWYIPEFKKNILLDYINYTHPINEGKYD